MGLDVGVGEVFFCQGVGVAFDLGRGEVVEGGVGRVEEPGPDREMPWHWWTEKLALNVCRRGVGRLRWVVGWYLLSMGGLVDLKMTMIAAAGGPQRACSTNSLDAEVVDRENELELRRRATGRRPSPEGNPSP